MFVLGVAGCGQVAVGVLLATSGGGGSSGGSASAPPASPPGPVQPTFETSLNIGLGPAQGGTSVVATVVGWTLEPGARLSVRVGTAAATSVERLDAQRLRFVTPLNPAGNRSTLQVVEVEAGEARSSNARWDYRAMTPQITVIEPTEVLTRGGTEVTLRGANYIPEVRVFLGSRRVTEVEVLSTTELRFIAPSGTVGPVSLEVQHPDDLRILIPDALRYVDGPLATLRIRRQPSQVSSPRDDPQPLVWFGFEEGEGRVVVDGGVGGGADGVWVGEPRWVPGVYGGGVAFAGDSHVSAGRLDRLHDNDPFTWSGFVRTEPGNDTRAVLWGNATGGTRVGLRSVGFDYPGGTIPVVLSPSRWWHVAVVKNRRQLTYYLDGEAVATTTYREDWPSVPFRLGGDPGAEHAVCALDEVRLFRRALTGAEVARLLAEWAPPPRALNPIEVELLDAEGELLSAFDQPVRLRLGVGAGTVSLEGALEVTPVGGVAEFSDVFVRGLGARAQLEVEAAGVQQLSVPFDVRPQTPHRLRILDAPDDVAVGGSLAPVRVEVLDLVGNRVPSPQRPRAIQLRIADHPSGAVLSGGDPVFPVDGVATFSDVRVDRVAFGVQLLAENFGQPGVRSRPFDVTAGPPAALAILAEPHDQTSGSRARAAVEVEVLDASGHRTDTPQQVTLSLASGPPGATLSGGGPVSSVGGVARFPDVSVDVLGGGYTLRAEATGLTPATTRAFAVVPPEFRWSGATFDALGGAGFGLRLDDVDGDGVLDRVHSLPDRDEVVVARLNPDGFAREHLRLAAVGGPLGVVTGDWNGDGASDVVVANARTDDVSLWLNDLVGGFGAPTRHEAALTPTSTLEAGDLDSDGILDVVVPSERGEDVYLLGGDGAGGFVRLPGTYSRVTGPESRSIRLADLDGDGDLDLLSADAGFGVVRVSLGFGNGETFGTSTPFIRAGEGVNDVEVLDVDRDGLLDVVFCNETEGTVGLAYNLGPEGNSPRIILFSSTVTLPVEDGPGRLAIADVDRDGWSDVLVTCSGADHLRVLRNEGGFLVVEESVYVGDAPGAIRAGDVDADGRVDVVVQGRGSGWVTTLLGAGQGAQLPVEEGCVQVVGGDLDGVGGDDLVAINGLGLHVLLADGAGGYAEPVWLRFGQQLLPAREVALADMDGDLDLDVVTTAQAGSRIDVYRNAGDGTFAAPEFVSVSGTQHLEVRDMDGDGRPDVVATSSGEAAVVVLYGAAGGGFDPAVELPWGVTPGDIAVGDLDGDGRLDVVGVLQGQDELRVALATGPRSFAASTSFPVAPSTWGVALADLDEDGDLDAITLHHGSERGLHLWAGDGAGGFAAAGTLATREDPSEVALCDLEGDGHLDVAVGGGDTLEVWRGRGDGTFSEHLRYAVRDAFGVTAHDLDGDGLKELVVPSLLPQEAVRVLRGR